MRFSLTRTCPISTSHSHFNSSFIGVISHVTSSPELQLSILKIRHSLQHNVRIHKELLYLHFMYRSWSSLLLNLHRRQQRTPMCKGAPRTIHCRARALPSMLMNADIITKPQKSLGGSTCHIRLYAP
ncbi:hypothetical protein BCIN_01g05040 [Botrytis cinerea B05.10]|uniref:Uncharacterized protein n=2 Tax=Botryotinia fuckeliana TaxID=40559 RepID=A0A384J5N5_BOTFB|nr:hypothetical protein BCIN_01g05040 [Botrytis cinerea B05.10]ATZ45783.1 hypothetical protein BCIN_01g05040 [Botrytis cinerea B05.10]EMR86089.1 hypothetical protein BcDW1_5309 [Botrytis cinerea BcDW1]